METTINKNQWYHYISIENYNRIATKYNKKPVHQDIIAKQVIEHIAPQQGKHRFSTPFGKYFANNKETVLAESQAKYFDCKNDQDSLVSRNIFDQFYQSFNRYYYCIEIKFTEKTTVFDMNSYVHTERGSTLFKNYCFDVLHLDSLFVEDCLHQCDNTESNRFSDAYRSVMRKSNGVMYPSVGYFRVYKKWSKEHICLTIFDIDTISFSAKKIINELII